MILVMIECALIFLFHSAKATISYLIKYISMTWSIHFNAYIMCVMLHHKYVSATRDRERENKIKKRKKNTHPKNKLKNEQENERTSERERKGRIARTKPTTPYVIIVIIIMKVICLKIQWEKL